MVWQILIDESVDKDWFVLAGYLARAQDWAKFSADWEALLPLTRAPYGKRPRFKMSEMAASHNCERFYRVIEKHVTLSFQMILDLRELSDTLNRMLIIDKSNFRRRPVRYDGSMAYRYAFHYLLGTVSNSLEDNPLMV